MRTKDGEKIAEWLVITLLLPFMIIYKLLECIFKFNKHEQDFEVKD